MDHSQFRSLVQQLYGIVAELEAMFPGRPFTPDGHMVGSLGECLVADAYNLTLTAPSNQGYDAVTETGEQVEIKATQGRNVAFRSCPEHTIVIKILKNGTFEECYNGPGEPIWALFEGRPRPSNGQFQVSLKRLATLNAGVPLSLRIPRRR